MPGLIRGVARTAAVVGTATVVSNGVSRRQQGRWAAEQQQAPPPAESAPPAAEPQPAPAVVPVPAAEAAAVEPVGVDMTDKLEQLKQLGELKTLGVLTDAEFETQKQKILGS